jgi:hypothetical protein
MFGMGGSCKKIRRYNKYGPAFKNHLKILMPTDHPEMRSVTAAKMPAFLRLRHNRLI